MKAETIAELKETGKLALGFMPWLLFLFLPTGGWNELRRAVPICLAAALLFGWKSLRRGFILQWATLAFFLFVTVALYGFAWVWLAENMAVVANAFLAGTIWATVLAGRPFTLQYAREGLPRDRWYDPALIRGCRSIAVFWGALLLVPTACNLFRDFRPAALPDKFYFAVSLGCIVLGFAYTVWYRRRKRRQHAAVSR
ncbi:MAG TPA: hypothetical protein PLI51_10515 [bacterium]|nr:hypothetical protein [bacterium]HPQ67148.1 hypothetical protein [bacterium]